MNNGDQNSQLGMIMAVLASMAVLGVLTLAFQQGLDERHYPNRDTMAYQASDGTLELELESNHQGHYLVDGEINGQAVTFFVDTGATRIAIPAHVADRLGLDRGAPVQTLTAGGRVTAYSTRLDTVDVGGIRRHGLRATINPHLEMDEILLGMNFLAPLELNQRDGRLTIRAPSQ